jgi:hypothetical protein
MMIKDSKDKEELLQAGQRRGRVLPTGRNRSREQ